MATSSTLIANPAGTVLSVAPSNTVQITPQELAGAAAGQRPDLLAFPDRIFQLTTDPTKFYAASGGALVLLPGSPALGGGALATTLTPPATGAIIGAHPQIPGEVAVVYSHGLEYALQPELSGNYAGIIPNAGSASLSATGTVASVQGLVVARSYGTADPIGRFKRVGYQTSNTLALTAAFVSARATSAAVFGSSNGTVGGFYTTMRWANTEITSPAGVFGGAGVQGDTTVTDPTTRLNHIGIYQIPTDPTQLYLCRAGSVAQTPIPLGAAFDPRPLGGTAGRGIPYEFNLVNLPSVAETFYWRVKRLDTGATVSGTLVATTPGVDLPSQATGLHPTIWRSNGATGGLVTSVDILGISYQMF